MPKQMYTLVQHTGYTVAKKPEFKRAVESAWISHQSDIRAIEKAGGVLFDTYIEAERAEYAVNYPDKDYQGYMPIARGRFVRVRLTNGTEMVYTPTPEDQQAFDVIRKGNLYARVL